MEIVQRSVQQIGSSYLISLPQPWVKALNIKKGTKLKIMTSDRGTLSISPEFIVEEKRKQSIIKYDEHFNRRFFREYCD